MRYRIKHVDMLGYFAQVQRGVFSEWKTIGKHSIGAGEYDENDIDHPLTHQFEAVLLCHRHAEFMGAKKGFTSYTDIIL